MTRQGGTGERKPLGRSAGFAAGLLALGLGWGAIELACWAVLSVSSQQPDPEMASPHLFDAYRGHRLNPTFALAEGTDGRRIHSIDGFRRDEPVSRSKPPGTIRVVLMGGSTVYGVGSGAPYLQHSPLRNNQTISHYLQALLNQAGAQDGIAVRVEVINAGVTAYHTFQHLVYLNAELLNYDPDWIINLDGHNDFYIDDPAHRHWLDYTYSSLTLVDLINKRSLLLSLHMFIRSLAPHAWSFALMEKFSKKAYKAAADRDHSDRPDLPWNAEDYIETARKGYLRALWQINRLGVRESYRHLVFLQPSPLFEDENLLTEHDRTVRAITAESYGVTHVGKMPLIRDLLPTLFAEEDIPFYDAAQLASSGVSPTDLYIDYCHLTPEGSQTLAKRVSEVLYPMIRGESLTDSRVEDAIQPALAVESP